MKGKYFKYKCLTLLQKGFVNWINLVSSNPNWVTTILEKKIELDKFNF